MTRRRRVRSMDETPVQRAAALGVATREENGATVAATDDVLRIARAITEHRAGLMGRLAR